MYENKSMFREEEKETGKLIGWNLDFPLILNKNAGLERGQQGYNT